ncbi:MAG: biotin/lipoyl-containing protein, partial [Rikenellaceae bacterium]
MEKIIVKTLHGSFETERLVDKYANKSAWKPKSSKCVYSFIPGTVEEIRVTVGEVVKKGHSLMLFKAMKMDNNILADKDGVIKSINVAVGENIPKGTAMIEFQ